MEFHNEKNLLFISTENLRALINSAVKAALLEHLSQKDRSSKEDQYLSIKDVVKLFHISRPTLTSLVKNNSVRSYRPGGIRRILFIESELREDLKNYPQR